MYSFLSLQFIWNLVVLWFPGGSVVKNPPAIAGDAGLIPVLGKSPGGGNDKPLQYSCLGNPLDRGAWWVTVHGVAKSQTWQWLNSSGSVMRHADTEMTVMKEEVFFFQNVNFIYKTHKLYTSFFYNFICILFYLFFCYIS